MQPDLKAGLASSASAVSKLSWVLIPVLGTAGALEGHSLSSAPDPIILSFLYGGIGALCGLLIGALLHSWFQMQARLARRIAESLDMQ